MKLNFIVSSSTLTKFLIFNFLAFLILGIFTFLYLNAIKPNLIKSRSNQHVKIIDNTISHIDRLNIKLNREASNNFLLSNRFLFQKLDRVQLFNFNGGLLADTDTLDLDQNAFSRRFQVEEEEINEKEKKEKKNKKSKWRFK